MSYSVYVLQDELTGILYKGMTSNLKKRLIQHNLGQNQTINKFTKQNLVLVEKFSTKHEAALREKYLKSGQGRKFLKSIISK